MASSTLRFRLSGCQYEGDHDNNKATRRLGHGCGGRQYGLSQSNTGSDGEQARRDDTNRLPPGGTPQNDRGEAGASHCAAATISQSLNTHTERDTQRYIKQKRRAKTEDPQEKRNKFVCMVRNSASFLLSFSSLYNSGDSELIATYFIKQLEINTHKNECSKQDLQTDTRGDSAQNFLHIGVIGLGIPRMDPASLL